MNIIIKSLFVIVGVISIISCSKNEGIKNDGFRDDVERKFMNEHGFQTKSALIEWLNADPNQKLKLSSQNFLIKTNKNHVIDCVSSAAIAVNYLNSNQQNITEDSKEANTLQLNLWSMIFENMIEEKKIDKDTGMSAIKEKVAEKSKDLGDEVGKQKLIKAYMSCNEEITPYFAEPEITAFENKSNSIKNLSNKQDSSQSLNTDSAKSDSIKKDNLESPKEITDNTPFAPSFDCTKAAASVEKLICGSRELSELDVRLNQLYSQTLNKSQDIQKVKSDQISWIKQTRACSDEVCVKQAQELRINQLATN